MDLSERIQDLIEASVGDLGYDIVRVLIMGKDHVVVQIMAEHTGDTTMTVDDCAEISRAVSAVLDVED